MSKYLIIRILGNDLECLHGSNQTYTNLEFTLKYEDDFPETDKIFIINRIVDIEKKNRIISLLNKHNVKYEDIPFDIEEFNKLSKINHISYSEIKSMDKNTLVATLVDHNLYLVNNNGARNYALMYGKKNNYDWTFVLDSNSYFTYESYNQIISNIDNDSEYIIISQKREIVKFILHFLLVVCFFNCYRKNEVECSSLLFASASFCHGIIGELGKPW